MARRRSVVRVDPEDEELLASPLHRALVPEPAARDPGEVRRALETWLSELPTSGLELAPELQPPDNGLLEAFRRGRLALCAKGQRVQEEGEEVRSYAIILQGRCRLRCRAPAKAAVAAEACEEEEAVTLDADGCVAYDVLQRGEALNMAPMEARSPCDVHCAEKSLLLLLSPEDYACTLRPFHRRLQTEAVDFLQRYGLCPLGTLPQLQRLATALRQRRLGRGRMLCRAGEALRHVWILRSGACQVLLDPQEQGEQGTGSSDESGHDDELMAKMQARPLGALGQAAACDEVERATLAKYAKPRFGRSLESRDTTGPGRKPSSAAAVLAAPGTMLGEELLLLEGRKQLAARCTASVRAGEESRFYVADLAACRQLGLYVRAEAIAEHASLRLTRRRKQRGRGGQVARELAREAQQLRRAEVAQQERQRLRLPPSVGYKGEELLEDVEDYLTAVFEHRKAPKNERSPATLSILEGLGRSPVDFEQARGVQAMLRVYSEPMLLRRHRESAGSSTASFRPAQPSSNPMGESAPAAASYVPPAARLALTAPEDAQALAGGSSIFFQTELEEQPGMQLSSSVPTLPKLSEATTAPLPLAAGSSTLPPGSTTLEPSKVSLSSSSKAAAAAKTTRLMKAFHRVVPGKCILAYVEKQDLRKSILQATLSAAGEIDLVFVKNSTELLTRLRDPKEQHDALLLDLSKRELQLESLLRTCRDQSSMPIIVLSAERQVPDLVQSLCSFVVFLPLSATTLREALVWCFQKRPRRLEAASDTSSLVSSERGQLSVTAMPLQLSLPVA